MGHSLNGVERAYEGAFGLDELRPWMDKVDALLA